jgi:hypothetical protein
MGLSSSSPHDRRYISSNGLYINIHDFTVVVFLWIWALYNHDLRVFKALSLLVFVEAVLLFVLLAKYHVSFQRMKIYLCTVVTIIIEIILYSAESSH